MKRVGVIIGAPPGARPDEATELVERLEQRFPGVAFYVIAGASSSVAFEFNEPPQMQ